jgi:hypothetical protein
MINAQEVYYVLELLDKWNITFKLQQLKTHEEEDNYESC